MKTKIARFIKRSLGLGFFFTSSAFASIVPGWSSNFLAGFGLGYIDLSGSAQTDFVYNASVPPGLRETIIRDYSDHKIFPSLVGGYQLLADRWVVGAEVNIDWQNLSRKLDFAFADSQNLVGWNGQISYDRKFVLGLTGRVGYSFVSFLMPYVRFGVEMSDDEIHSFYRDNTGNITFPTGDGHTETWVYRFLLGVGGEIPLPTCLPLSLRMEYNYHSKGKTLDATSVGAGGVAPVFDASLQPWGHSGRVVLVWNFF